MRKIIKKANSKWILLFLFTFFSVGVQGQWNEYGGGSYGYGQANGYYSVYGFIENYNDGFVSSYNSSGPYDSNGVNYYGVFFEWVKSTTYDYFDDNEYADYMNSSSFMNICQALHITPYTGTNAHEVINEIYSKVFSYCSSWNPFGDGGTYYYGGSTGGGSGGGGGGSGGGPSPPTTPTPELKNWYLDNDNDGYESRTQKAETSPGSGWKEGASMGIDCNDNDPVIRECIEPKPVEVINPATCRCIDPPNKPKFNNVTNVWNVLDGKKWIDYWDFQDCAKSAKAQNKESTLLATPVGGGYQVNTFVDKKRQTESGKTTPNIDLQKAIDVIAKNLKEGKPVMVGVMYERYLGADLFPGGTAGDNNNVATNHFVTIVGMGIDNGKPYFQYYDNYVDYKNKDGSTRSKATVELLGTNVSSNRLYCYPDSVGNYYFADKEATTIIGPSHGYTLQYVLTEVRDNQ
jgi:hypothetical protein